MARRYVYFYLLKDDFDEVADTISTHIEYWMNLELAEYAAGPFSDRSGGMVVFASDDMTQAQNIIKNDPFMKEGLINSKWIKEWVLE